MSDKLQQAIALIKAGDKEQGGELLAEILLENPDVELAWLWRSGVVQDDEERAYCLQQVLALNPDNEVAQKGLAMLRTKGVRVEAGDVGPEGGPVQGEIESSPGRAAVGADDPALVEYVVREIGQQAPRQDVIYEVCQRTGMSWPMAEAFVQRVEADRSQEIRGRQRPLLILVAVITLMGGVYFFFTNISYLIPVFQDPLAAVLSAPYIWGRVVLVVTGAAMVVGSLLGLWQSLSPSTAPPLIDLAQEGTGSNRYKSVDDMFEVGIYVGSSGSRRRRRRRGTRIF
ncbi:MAG: hypothetical protein JXA93_23010 [Anaerolineae bacterium]|nr:hypothetical protein [Anaerolineae bacterium]